MPEETAYIPPAETDTDTSDPGAKTAADLASKLVPSPRDLLREAADKALSEEATEEGKEAPPEPKTPKPANDNAAKPEGEEEAPKGMPKIAAALRAREAAQKVRDGAKVERDQILQEATQQRAAAVQQMAEIQKMRQELDADRQRLARLKSNPMEAIRDLGWDPKQLVDGVIRDGTPEWQALQKQRTEMEQMAEKLRTHERALDEQAKARELYGRQQQQQARMGVVEKFLALVPAESALRSLYDDAEIVAKGDRMADAYREKTGEVARLEEIRDALEYEARERLGKASQQASEVAGKTAPKQRAGSGPRTLSSSASSERRAAPKQYSEAATANERRKLLEEAANEAMKAAT